MNIPLIVPKEDMALLAKEWTLAGAKVFWDPGLVTIVESGRHHKYCLYWTMKDRRFFWRYQGYYQGLIFKPNKERRDEEAL